MASKVSLLSQRLRGAQFEVSDLRGNFDRLLHDLEDAVFIFDREIRLMFASGSVEKFLGRDRGGSRAALALRHLPAQHYPGSVDRAGRRRRAALVRNRRVPIPLRAAQRPLVVLLSVDLLESMPGGATGIGSVGSIARPGSPA